jgi:hypothetical protein
MNVCVLGYGRVWSTRAPGPRRAATYFNTTGVVVHGIPRTRSHIYGYVRIDECLGFHPDQAERTIHGVFSTDGLTVWNGRRKLFFQTRLPKSAIPDRYLVRVSESEVGCITRTNCWLCDAGEVISFSDGNGQQEILILLPAFGWLRSSNGLFHLVPDAARPCAARFQQYEG